MFILEVIRLYDGIMTNCETTIRSLPSTVSSRGLELRVGPPMLTMRDIEELQRQGKMIFLDETFNGVAFAA